MASEWFYQVMGTQVGPVSSVELRNLAQAGTVTTETPVANAPSGPWVSAGRVKGLFAVPNGAPPPAAATGTAQVPPPHATVSEESLGLETATKITLVVGGGVCILVLGFLVWFIAGRDTWELNNASRVSAKLDEADRLQQSDFVAAYKTYDEVLKEAKQHKIADSQFAQKLADAEKSRIALYPKVQEKIQAEEAEKRRLAEEEARRAAEERQRVVEEENRKKEAMKAARKRIEEEKRLASVKANIKGGAWLRKKAGNSEILRGLQITVVRAHATKEQFQAMLQALLVGKKQRLEAAKDVVTYWEKHGHNYGSDFSKKKLEKAKQEVLNRELLVKDAEETIRKAATTTAKSVEIADIYSLYSGVLKESQNCVTIYHYDVHNDVLDYTIKSPEHERSAWATICAEQAVANVHTDVDGKYKIEVSGGYYYIYAIFDSSYSEAEWFIPVKVIETNNITVDLHNENAASITNKGG